MGSLHATTVPLVTLAVDVKGTSVFSRLLFLLCLSVRVIWTLLSVLGAGRGRAGKGQKEQWL